MPRIIPLLTLLLALVLPHALAGPAVPQAVHGSAHATKFFVHSMGPSHDVEDGLYDYHALCTDCFVNVTINGTGIVFVEQGQVMDLTPGVWQIREFAGSVSYQRHGLGNFTVSFEGTGRVMRVA